MGDSAGAQQQYVYKRPFDPLRPVVCMDDLPSAPIPIRVAGTGGQTRLRIQALRCMGVPRKRALGRSAWSGSGKKNKAGLPFQEIADQYESDHAGHVNTHVPGSLYEAPRTRPRRYGASSVAEWPKSRAQQTAPTPTGRRHDGPIGTSTRMARGQGNPEDHHVERVDRLCEVGLGIDAGLWMLAGAGRQKKDEHNSAQAS